MTDERQARMGLLATFEPGSLRLADLVARHGACELWRGALQGVHGERVGRRARAVDLAAMGEGMERCGARFLIPGDDEWPTQLDVLDSAGEVAGLGGAPIGLWVRGPARVPAGGVAVVGARACTSYGTEVAMALAGDVAAAGVPIISGGAYGIDAAAHRGALVASGPTVAVLACGVDEAYPSGQAAVLEKIAREHTVVSEYAPGSRPTRMRFLARNRLIAALADGTLLVEAAARSGARNTVNWAQRCGRVVMATPGPIHSSMSYLPHLLLRDQEAVLVDDAASVLALVEGVGQAVLFDAVGEVRAFDELPPREKKVLEAIPGRGSITSGELADLVALPIRELAVGLRSLERSGFVTEEDGLWRLVRADASGVTVGPKPRSLVENA